MSVLDSDTEVPLIGKLLVVIGLVWEPLSTLSPYLHGPESLLSTDASNATGAGTRAKALKFFNN